MCVCVCFSPGWAVWSRQLSFYACRELELGPRYLVCYLKKQKASKWYVDGTLRQDGNMGFQNEFRTRRAAIYPDPRFFIPENVIYPRCRFIYPVRFFLIPETALIPKRALLYT